MITAEIQSRLEEYHKQIGIFVLVVHISGAIGMMSPLRMYFLALTPLNLVFSFLLVTYFHPERTPVFWRNLLVIVSLGFIIELIGVNTGWPFGIYQYEWAFGPQLWNTPVVIGLNWFIMTYSGVYILGRIFHNDFTTAILSGVCITLLDVILEPVAINSSYWTWASEHVPFNNYVTWFICISLFSFLILRTEKRVTNPLIKWVFGAQLVFFLSLYVFYQYT